MKKTARLAYLQRGAGPHFQALPSGRDQSSLDTIKIKMVRLNRIINVQRNNINTVQHNQIWADEKMTGGRALAGGAESFARRRPLSQFSVCRQQRGKIF
jgi:hypothetical protein